MTSFEDALGAIYRKEYSALRSVSPALVSAVDREGHTLLMYAINADQAELSMVELLIELGCPVNAVERQGWTALHFAARNKQPDFVRIVLAAGATVDAEDTFGQTPLARSLNQLPFNYETIRLLLRAGADPNHKNKAGNSPMDLARLTGDKELESALQKSANAGR